MKKISWHKCFLWLALMLFSGLTGLSQDSAKKELLVDLGYFMPANRVPYLKVNTKTKIEKRFLPVPGIRVTVYMDSAENTLATVTTEQNGSARINFTPELKKSWDAAPTHTFTAVSEATKEFDEVTTEISVTKSKIVIDTVADAETRSLRVMVMQLSDNGWIPANEVELKLGVKRMGGELMVGEEESYTTDSTGEAIAEFKREQLPGDTAGNLTLVARVEDNDQLGNLFAEATVPWGMRMIVQHKPQARTLWATGEYAPVWLIATAIFIIAVVWGTIFYLVFQIIKIRKIGLSHPA
ncbi:MAG TPA: Ig-like domain-containing protein [Chitinophagaceae bacterium]